MRFFADLWGGARNIFTETQNSTKTFCTVQNVNEAVKHSVESLQQTLAVSMQYLPEDKEILNFKV